MNKIRHSKEGIKASEFFLSTLKKSFPPIHIFNISVFVYDLFDIIKCSIDKNVNIKHSVILVDFFVPLLTFSAYSFLYMFCTLCMKNYKDIIINEATIDLQQLASQLIALEVKTSAELLQESKINQINYKIKFVDEDINSKKMKKILNRDKIKIPKLKQYKYIDIPLSNGYEETLLQEYTFGDKYYELSVNEPDKKVNMSLVKQM